MYGVFTCIYYKNQPNVGKYTIHGCYGIEHSTFSARSDQQKQTAHPSGAWKTGESSGIHNNKTQKTCYSAGCSGRLSINSTRI